MKPSFRIGIDLGGTKIEAIALDSHGTVRLRHRVQTPAGDADRTIAAIRDLVHAVEAKLGGKGTVGMGTPGSLSPVSGLLRNANSTCLNGLPLDRLIAQALGREVRIANDANCFALSEAADGAAAGATVVFGVILGTGVGGGLVIDGKLLHGRHGIGGEWGHNPLPWPTDAERPGPACFCGRSGCIETFLSGPGMAADHRAAGGSDLSAREIAAQAESGDPAAQATLDRYIDRLARGLAHVINLVDPDVIVLGGGLSNLALLYDSVPARWGRHVFSDVVATRLVPPRHGDSSGVRGAAWLWPAQ
ncbi:MAG: family Glucokinase with ambiguous substrate specificity [Rhodospirillales bacterium]|nr:family Glucokinase with ambiguous substrate specificity [Rhodospirillales bacterium]